MPRIPQGSWPPGRYVRNVVPTEFENLLAVPNGGGSGDVIPAADSLVSAIYDCLTPVYRGRGDSATLIGNVQRWTRFLGVPGTAAGPANEIRTQAVFMDLSCWLVLPLSIIVEWIYGFSVLGAPFIGASYRWLPVGNCSAPPLIDLVPVPSMMTLRVPTPWVRFTYQNESGAVDFDPQTDGFLHVWFRGA